MNKFSKKQIIILVALVLVVAGGIVYSRGHGTAEQKQQAENVRLLQSVGRLIVLPNEQPIIATINQADTLVKEQPFYAGSQNGDKLIIFPKAQKAIIYSPTRNIIINAGPFVINGSATTGTPTTPTPTPAKK